MTERQITFIDADENPLVACLRSDRVQLVVMDSRPELVGDELLAFATALFGAYLGGPLAERLAAACGEIDGVRAQLVATGAHDAAATLEHARQAIGGIADAMAAAAGAAGPSASQRPANAAGDRPPGLSGWQRELPRGPRLRDGSGVLGWGWVRGDDDASVAA